MTRERLTAETVRAVRGLYDELWNVAPDESGHRTKIAASRARNYARARGWAPPLAWDEEQLDAPDGKAAEGWQRPDRHRSRAADLAEDAEFVRQVGGYALATNTEVAMRLGVPKTQLEKALERTRSREAPAEPEARGEEHEMTYQGDARAQDRAGRREVAARQTAARLREADAAVLARAAAGDPQPGMTGPGWSGPRNADRRAAARRADEATTRSADRVLAVVDAIRRGDLSPDHEGRYWEGTASGAIERAEAEREAG